jgi:DNA-binding transcriptional MerR regulator
MDEAPLEGVEAEGDLTEGEEVAAEATQQSEGDEPARQYVEVDEPESRFVRVRVNNEDVEVPYSDLLRSYSQEASYTQKSQALAERAREADYGIRLQQALQANPEMTLQILANQYGLTVAQVGKIMEQNQPEPEYQDPLERQLAEQQQRFQSLEERIAQREADEQLERSISGLRQQFNASDDDIRSVVQTAYEMQVGPEAFPQIFKAMAFDKLQQAYKVRQAAEQAKQAEQAKRVAAKQAATGVVSAGTGAAGTTTQVDADQKMTLRQAIDAAFSQLGVEG